MADRCYCKGEGQNFKWIDTNDRGTVIACCEVKDDKSCRWCSLSFGACGFHCENWLLCCFPLLFVPCASCRCENNNINSFNFYLLYIIHTNVI